MRDKRHVDKFPYLGQSFYYEPYQAAHTPSKEFTQIVRDICRSNGWKILKDGPWIHVEPEVTKLPLQGWKIHVSATLRNAERILQKAAKILIQEGVPFKFALDRRTLAEMNYKNWHRGSSGKFMTIYPTSMDEFKKLLTKLYTELKDEEGPYILSDKRYKQAKVLYYRYGGIRKETIINIMGEEVPVLVSPSGENVPDIRTPYFNPPTWAKDPFPDTEEESEPFTLRKGRYSITSAISFSNAGGVYLAQDNASGESVVIKEARPHTGMDDMDNEAVGLLRKEYEILKVLEDDGATPRPIDLFQEWEHLFLVEEYIEGVNIREVLLTANPLAKVKPSLKDTKAYYEIFTKIFLSLSKTLEIVHKRGIILGDLSANNLIINPQSYTVRLIDLEGAFRLGIDKPTYLLTPGFRNVQNVFNKTQSFDDDLFTLGVVMFYFLFPINAISDLRQDIYDKGLKGILRDLGWPQEVFNIINGLVKGKADYSDVIRSLSGWTTFKKPKIQECVTNSEICTMVERFGEFILNNIEDDREDRLFPADPFLYRTNPLSLGFGASGVMYALKKCDFEIPKRAYNWFEKKLKDVNGRKYPPGLLTGTSGIAWAIWELGYEDEALRMMEIANEHRLLASHHSLFYGAAGVGMTNLYLYLKTKDKKFLDCAVALGDQLLKTAKRNERGIYWEDDEGKAYLGYGYGQSGVALYLLKLYQLTGNEFYLLHGKQAVDFDLSYGIEQANGVFTFTGSTTDTSTFEPYLEAGSAGVIKVLLRYGMWDKIEGISDDLHRKYSVFCGLLFGLGSFVDVFTDMYIFSKNEKYLRMGKRPVAGIQQLYLLKTSQGLATPGDGLFRISCDYATGVAGVMRTLHRYRTLDQADFTLDEVS